jgi:hypothetical protein
MKVLSLTQLGAESNLEELFDMSILLLAATTPAPSYTTTSTSSSTNEKTPSTEEPVPHDPHHFDFFLLHLLLSAHAIRVLFKNLPFTTHQTMLEAHFLATISYYVSELRPAVKIDVFKDHAMILKKQASNVHEATQAGTGGEDGMDWSFVRRKCFEGDVGSECANGGNYVKALRALREAEMEYGFKDGLYLNTALMIVEQVTGVIGD